MRPDSIVLEDDADVALFRRNIDLLLLGEDQLAVDIDIALVRIDEPA